ncbi:MAG: SHOCT domain-containing protein [Opitutaceae bacterium]
MNTPALRRIFAAIAMGGTLAGCSYSTSNVASLGGNLYCATSQAATVLNRSGDKLKEEATQDAEKFCEIRGKQIQIVDVTVHKPLISSGFVTAKVTFRALNPGEAPVAAPAENLTAAPSEMQAPVAQASVDDPYTQLIKLDDLHKRGIITDKEFKEEKQKILARWQ